MTLYHCSLCQSASSQKWPGDQWERTHSCAAAAHFHDFSHDCHRKHNLRRSLSDPGMCCSASTLVLKPQQECSALQNMLSIDDSVILSIHSTTNLLENSPSADSVDNSRAIDLVDNLQQLAQGQQSVSEDTPKRGWNEICDKLDDNDNLFGRDELVHLDDYYYEDEENKSQIISFRNCSLRLHGLLFLIIIYAAGYLAYIFVAPLSKRKCQQPPSIVPPVIP